MRTSGWLALGALMALAACQVVELGSHLYKLENHGAEEKKAAPPPPAEEAAPAQ